VGLGALVNLNKTCKANGGKFAIFNLAPEIVEVLKITKLDRVVNIAKDRDAAIKAVS
jgi:anti-anti-sigma factor